MLVQSHPKYLSQLSINVAQVKSGSDKAVMMLTIISMAIFCIQIPIGQSVHLKLEMSDRDLFLRCPFSKRQGANQQTQIWLSL
jgi:hypothetical protein